MSHPLSLLSDPAAIGHYFDLADYILFKLCLSTCFAIAVWRFFFEKEGKKRK
jgi:hypothetical protein